MTEKFTQKAKDTLNQSSNIAKKYGHGFIGTEHMLLGLLKVKDSVAEKALTQKGITFKNIEEKVLLVSPKIDIDNKIPRAYTPMARKIIEESFNESVKFNSNVIGTEHILLALLNEKNSIAVKILEESGLDVQHLKLTLLAMLGATQQQKKIPNFLPMGKVDDVKEASRTQTLDKFSRDFTEMAKNNNFDPIVKRENEIERLIQILSRRTKNNPVLVGQPGVGKTAIVEGLAERIATGVVPTILLEKRVVSLDLSSVVAGSKYRGEFEDRLKKIMNEVIKQKDVILFIDEIHTLVGAGGAEGAMDASNILKPFLSRGEIQVIGATTNEEYRKYIEKDQALERRFAKITVEEPNAKETIDMLKVLRDKYEAHHDVTITDEAINSAVSLSIRYIQDRFLPDKAIDVIDEACSKAKLVAYTTPPDIKSLEQQIEELNLDKVRAIKNEDYKLAQDIKDDQAKLEKKLDRLLKKWSKTNQENAFIVDEEIVTKVVSSWTGVPITSLDLKDKEKLLNLEKLLHERVIGQKEAVVAIAKAIRRSRVGLKDPKRPIGSFLFLGPTGVGKTELSKALSEVLFGDDDAMIRIDMSEYMEKHAVSKLIGSPPGYVGYEEGGQLSEKVRRKPYSVILIDEIEKAHEDVFNILLQILDDGHITDSQGRKIDFKNCVIIMTSNVGGKSIVEPKQLGFISTVDTERDYKEMKSKVLDEVKKLFKPEFLNRIDEMVVFHPLTMEDIGQIAKIFIDKVVVKASENVKININYDDKVVAFISKKGYNHIYGARPLRRTIQSEFEDYLAEQILSNELKEGDRIDITEQDEKLVFTKNE